MSTQEGAALTLRQVQAAADYARIARRRLDAATWAHIAEGAGSERTLRANRAAYARHAIVPRVLRRCSDGNTTLRLLGHARAHPFLLAPVSMHALVHPDGELATADGASIADAILAISTLASRRLDDVAARARSGRWFQLYAQSHAADTTTLLRRAEDSGCEAVVLTVDAPVTGPRPRSARLGFAIPDGIRAVNLPPARPPGAPHTATLDETAAQSSNGWHSRVFRDVMASAPDWETLEQIVAATPLPVLVKGVLHPADAVRVLTCGAAGVIVSNHGGRTLDGAPASLDCLPAIRAAVGDDATVLLDGGIRSGADAFMALALGADAVLVGRLQLFALAAAGALGVAHMLRTLREELELTMALAGCATLDEIGRACARPPGARRAEMLCVIEGLLDATAAATMRTQLLGATWVDGRTTAGAIAVDAKRNRQLADDDSLARRLSAEVQEHVRRHREFLAAALPARLMHPRFNRHGPGEYYDAHVDAALMRTPEGHFLRTDVSATLFLTDPDTYAGGELQIETGFGTQDVKLNAGDLVLYPATSLHRVAPVTAGERICCFFWIESMVADAGRRAILHALDTAIRELRRTPGTVTTPIARLAGVYHNLLRTWATS